MPSRNRRIGAEVAIVVGAVVILTLMAHLYIMVGSLQ